MAPSKTFLGGLLLGVHPVKRRRKYTREFKLAVIGEVERWANISISCIFLAAFAVRPAMFKHPIPVFDPHRQRFLGMWAAFPSKIFDSPSRYRPVTATGICHDQSKYLLIPDMDGTVLTSLMLFDGGI